ncbi:MAG TPA: peptide deformylase [Levilinea sp.]|nr:peptide deformylase [Levilinea sp.]
MAVREIVTIPHPVLRKKARKVTEVGADVRQLINEMVEAMREAPGVGLAAPQVGVSSRVIVVEFGDDENEDAPKKLYALINPEVVEMSDEKISAIEGCLSVPRLVGEVERHQRIVVKALNRFGKPVKLKAEGWLARILQHEIDHLDGILYTDRATRVWQPSEDEEQVIAD